MATGYLRLLRTRHTARLLAGTLVGRLPNATAALAVVLFTRAEGGSYSLAGALSAVYGLATAAGQPLLGRAVDLWGQPRVVLPAAVLSALGMGVFAVSGLEPAPVAYAAMLVAGLCTPPLEGGLRALWPSILGRQDQVHSAYALDAVAQELMYAVGPLLVTLLIAVGSEAAALLVLNALGVLGALWVVASEPSRRWRSAPREAHWLGALRSRGMLAVLASFFFVGGALGSTGVAAVAYGSDRSGGTAAASLLLSALGVGALLGGLGYGARTWPGRAERRLRLLVALLALGYLPLALTPGLPAMTALAVLSGVFLAPALACSFVVIDRHAPAGTVTEAFSWLVTTAGVGIAAGTAGTGPAVEAGGAPGGYLVTGGCGVAALVVLLATTPLLAAPADPRRPGTSPENDRNGAAEPGFTARHRA